MGVGTVGTTAERSRRDSCGKSSSLLYRQSCSIVKHILPNTISYVIVYITLQIPGFILLESSLSFLGLGIQEPQSSWGNMLSKATDLTALTRYPWLLVPGVFIFITVLAWNFVGDGIRDALDPRAVTSGNAKQ